MTMIGPKKRPTAPVPKRWTKNSTREHDQRDRDDEILEAVVDDLEALDRADSTQIAGVIIPSP